MQRRAHSTAYLAFIARLALRGLCCIVTHLTATLTRELKRSTINQRDPRGGALADAGMRRDALHSASRNCRSCCETPQNELVSSLNCYGSGYCLFNERSGLRRICPVKIAKRDDRRAEGIEDIKARVEVPPISHVLHFSNSVLHWLCLGLVALAERRPPRALSCGCPYSGTITAPSARHSPPTCRGPGVSLLQIRAAGRRPQFRRMSR
jgi:hypothetical protein